MDKKHNILIVDDETVITELLKQYFEAANFNVTAFNDSKEALDYFTLDPESLDLVITDYQMSEMTGLEFAKEVRDKKPAMPVVMMTGFSNPSLINMAAAQNINEFIEKPFVNLRTVLEVVEKSIEQHSDTSSHMDTLYNQFIKILKMAVDDKKPDDSTSVNFIIQALEKNGYDRNKLEILKGIEPLLTEHIKYLKAREIYIDLKENSEMRKDRINGKLSNIESSTG